MFRKLILLIVSAACFYSGGVLAVGLGEYELDSGLNQPLKAKITLLSAGELSEHEVHASLASLQEFEKVGVDRLFFLNSIRFETVRDDNGNVVIHLTSREPIKEPFLNFLVELNWPNGRIIREYTFLLDPPIFEESTSSTIERSQTQSSQTAEPAAPQTSYTPRQTEEPRPAFTGSTYGPVNANDTLWSIASSTRPQGATIHQTLVAIYRANPNAFANGNINNLMRGEVLQIPDANVISQVPHRAALQDVVVQNRQWRSGGARRIVENTSGQTSSSQTSSEARLSLSTPSSDSSSDAASGSGFTDRLADTENQLVESQEKSATLQAENDELRARLADALSKLEQTQSGSAVDIADTELAALTQSQQTDSPSSDTATDSSTTDSVVGGETQASDLTTDSSQTDPVGESPDETTSEVAQADSDTGTTQPETTPAEQTSTQPKPTTPVFNETPASSGGLLDSGAVLWGGIVGVVVLIALAVFWRMRKRMEEDDFQDDLVASAGAGSMDTTETFELPDVGDDMLVELDMDEEPEAETESDEENFDPLGEADIYIAYGKYEQAESLLTDAIEENPIRSDLKVKLMECYAETEDGEKFESLAQEVSQAVDAEEWNEQIDKLRTQAFGGEAAGADDFDLPSTEDIFGEDDDFESELDSIGEEAEELDLGSDGDEEEFDIDMDLDSDEVELDDVNSDAVTETFDSLDDEDFSLDDLEEESGDFSLDESDEGDDFELDLDESADDIDLDDSDDISLDLDDDEFSFDESDDDDFGAVDEADGDEISTKLDLARAYIDMGDADGAKEILSEVVAEGNDEQQSEAKALMEKMD
ncbi:MAG: hypothetical protein OQK04_02585 [Kangiellaceae bacterium]|nr:hypothetical protein [Kangiellaceae bacterium]MCW8997591.1 hypothetical protein [Kangiellaceae bacterium]